VLDCLHRRGEIDRHEPPRDLSVGLLLRVALRAPEIPQVPGEQLAAAYARRHYRSGRYAQVGVLGIHAGFLASWSSLRWDFAERDFSRPFARGDFGGGTGASLLGMQKRRNGHGRSLTRFVIFRERLSSTETCPGVCFHSHPPATSQSNKYITFIDLLDYYGELP
jgi:hypothetical protein